jgi:DNA polymerase III gamma/tau subunit
MPEDRARVIAAMSQGSLGRAVSLADGAELERRDGLIQALAAVRSGDLEALLGFAEDFRDGHQGKEQLRELLDLWELWCRDLLLAGLALPGQLLVNQDCAERLASEASKQSPGAVLRILHQLRRTRAALAANANPRMALEALLLSTRIS